MPELPEVETVVRGLRQSVLGRKILSVWIGKSDFIDNPEEFARLSGQTIAAVERFGKFMLLRLASGDEVESTTSVAAGQAVTDTKSTAVAREYAASLLVHLGMTGQIAPIAA